MAPPKLPDEALQALRHGRKIEAIRLVRERQGVDVGAATDAVEAALSADPWLKKQCASASPRSGSGWRILTWVLAMIAAVIACLKLSGRF